MNEALETDFDPIEFGKTYTNESQTENDETEEDFDESNISPEERQSNLMETMIGEAQKEIEYIEVNVRQVIKPTPANNN
jgi:hypothetical protein